MTDQAIQNKRYQLQKRYRSLKSKDSDDTYMRSLRHFWNFLYQDSFYRPIIELIKSSNLELLNTVKSQFKNSIPLDAESYENQVIYAVAMIEMLLQQQTEIFRVGERNGIYQLSDSIDFFTEEYVQTLYDYLDESLDSSNSIIAHLLRYKQRTELFTRKDLLEKINLYENSTEDKSKRVEEKILMPDLYLYLHDQGLEIGHEIKTAMGRVDFVGIAPTIHPFASEGKIYDPTKSKGIDYLKEGILQITTYCDDLMRNLGYLIIFNSSDHILHISGSDIDQSSLPLMFTNNKIVTIIVINLNINDLNASELKEGKNLTTINLETLRPQERSL